MTECKNVSWAEYNDMVEREAKKHGIPTDRYLMLRTLNLLDCMAKGLHLKDTLKAIQKIEKEIDQESWGESSI